MDQKQLINIANKQRDFFFAGTTKEIAFRVKQLYVFKKAIEENEEKILGALKLDLGKPEIDAYTSEIAPILQEIDYALKKIKSWDKPKKVSTPFMLFPGSSYIYPEPYGSVLIIGTWNYPFQLVISPLVGAMAAGNCSVVKPSEISSNASQVIANIIRENFNPLYIAVVEGGVEETQMLLSQKFDYIFFTGGTRVGQIIMEAAAKHLTPVTLELGGKNPCIVDEDVDIETTARRIAWGKYFNAGQTCIAPDYLLAHMAIKDKLLENIKVTIEKFYGKDPSKSLDYARIINKNHFSRLSALLGEGNIIKGGNANPADFYIAPTVIDNISWDNEIMEDEIFGPILPVIEYEDLDEVISLINRMPKPLAIYFFSKNKNKQEKVLKEISSGGVSINDIMAHIQNINLPFGGVGDSGIGAYHGKASFDTFSHKKSVRKRSFFDYINRMKYPPYKTPLKYVKKILKFIS